MKDIEMVNEVYPSPTSPTQGPQRTLPLAPPKGGEYNVLLMGHKSVVTTPSPCGRVGEGSVLRTLQKPLHPSLRGAGRKILLSSMLGPRMESAVNMNERAHDNMSASHGRCENGKENEKT